MTARHRPRVLVAALAAAALLAACGAEDPMSSPSTSADPGALRPPVAVDAAFGSAAGAGGDARAMTAESAASTDLSILPAFGGFTYEVGDSLPPLPAATTAYQYPPGADVDEAAVAALAGALGVDAPLERVEDADTGLLWRAGPDDGTAASLGVSRDPQLSWYYSGAWADQAVPECRVAVLEGEVVPTTVPPTTMIVGGDAVAGDEGGGTDPCAAPEPPAGVPTAPEAESTARDLLAAIGQDPTLFELETFADEWYASVVARPSFDGVPSPVSYGFGFGAEGVLQSANGSLADPVPAGPYPLVDLDTAIARLNEQSSPAILARGGPAVDVIGPATGTGSDGSTGVDKGTATATSTATTGTPVPAPAPLPPDSIAASPPIAIDPPQPGVDPGVPAEPEVATLVDVRADFWWVWDADGSVWLLPAYTFTDSEGRQHTVPAVTDEFLVVADTPTSAPPVREPATTVPPDVLPPASGAPVTTTTTVDPAAVVGRTVEEAERMLTEVGLSLRVVREDGVDLVVTDDYVETRVNVAVDSGTVSTVVSLG